MGRRLAARPRERAGGLDGGKYIYAVVGSGSTASFDFPGINDRPIELVTFDGIASVVSDLAAERIRPERRHLAAHRAVLARLIEREGGVLPMRFGAIASGPAEIIRLLSRNRDLFARQLRRVAGKVEMGLRVAWDVPNIFEYFVNTNSDLRKMRDKLFLGAAGPRQEERIELGRTFERLLNETRLAHTGLVEDILSAYCSEISHNAIRQESEIMNLACLVARERRKDFENGVLEAARRFDNNFAFDYNGPWAPHSFAEISLRG
ncbi:MAG TPA: GvpL/GvpF family gas vesicle protein [Candidatus Binataceae bacterium]|nr:GvpL/GvpF family gas vesicle protein [Candidatus Binataceae bacterium]